MSNINKTEKTFVDSFSDHHENAEVMNNYLLHYDEVKTKKLKGAKITVTVNVLLRKNYLTA